MPMAWCAVQEQSHSKSEDLSAINCCEEQKSKVRGTRVVRIRACGQSSEVTELTRLFR